jgi:hypothetical protein
MTRAFVVLGAALIALGGLHAPAGAQPALQPEDRGGPGYTTGTTMGRDPAPFGASSAGARGPLMGQRQETTTEAERARDRTATASAPGMHRRRTKTIEGGAGTTGGPGPGAAPTGR